jgi:hypothetical protein
VRSRCSPPPGFSQRAQFQAQTLVHEAVEREALYAEFIIEASKRFTEAWSRQAETPEVVAGLYSAVERVRLTSSNVAEQVGLQVVEAYADAPTKRSTNCGRSYETQTTSIRSGTSQKHAEPSCMRCAADRREPARAWPNGGYGSDSGGPMAVPRVAGIGAASSLPRAPAKVCSPPDLPTSVNRAF